MATITHSDGTTFTVKRLDARTAQRLMLRLGKAAGGVMALIGSRGIDGSIDARDVRLALATVEESDLDAVIEAFRKVSEVQLPGATITLKLSADAGYGLAFEGQHARFLAWIWGALKAEFADFFAELASMLAAQNDDAKGASPST